MGYQGALCLVGHLTSDLEGLASETRQVRHLKVKRTDVAHRLPRGKRATWDGNQHLQEHQCLGKQPFYFTYYRGK